MPEPASGDPPVVTTMTRCRGWGVRRAHGGRGRRPPRCGGWTTSSPSSRTRTRSSSWRCSASSRGYSTSGSSSRSTSFSAAAGACWGGRLLHRPEFGAGLVLGWALGWGTREDLTTYGAAARRGRRPGRSRVAADRRRSARDRHLRRGLTAGSRRAQVRPGRRASPRLNATEALAHLHPLDGPPGAVDLPAAEQAAATCSKRSASTSTARACATRRAGWPRMYAELLTPGPFNPTTFPNDAGYDELVVVRRHPVPLAVRAPPAPVHRRRARRLPARRADHRPLEARARGRAASRASLQVQERLTTQVAGTGWTTTSSRRASGSCSRPSTCACHCAASRSRGADRDVGAARARARRPADPPGIPTLTGGSRG